MSARTNPLADVPAQRLFAELSKAISAMTLAADALYRLASESGAPTRLDLTYSEALALAVTARSVSNGFLPVGVDDKDLRTAAEVIETYLET